MALTIGQVAKTSGIAPKTIRFYEAAGVLPSPSRTASGYRQYTAAEVEHLLFVRRARMLGLPLRHLKTLTIALDGGGRQAMRGRMREMIRAHLSTVQARMREGGDIPRSETATARANERRGSRHQRSSSRAARPWCLCRGGGLRRHLAQIVRSKT